MAEFAVAIVEKLAEKLIDPIIRQFSYVFCYKSNIKSLEDGVEDLQNKKSDVSLSVDAHNRNLDIIGRDVDSWLTKVDENDKDARKVLEGKKIVQNGCLNGWCPSLKQRYLVSRKAVKQIVVVKELQKDGEKYTQLAYPALPAGTVTSKPTASLEVFESRISQTKEVIKALTDERFSKIGVCGLGGVGKTRMAKEIRDRAIAEDLFDEVAMAVVTENQDANKIQDQLASMLGLELDEKNITDIRGKRLCARLTNGRRILVILDDVWKELDLEELGIPVVSQVESKGCKVLITSRDEHVCTATGTEKNVVVKLLSDTEAWDLFSEKAGFPGESCDRHPIARQVAEECGCLPLAIVTVATALKCKDNEEWQDALEQLQMSNVISIQGMEKNVYSRLRLSYNLLENNQLQRLFLLCCIFPEDYDISFEQLTRYALGLRLFNDMTHVAAVRRRVLSLVNQLKGCYLLLASDKARHVKVHDVVRDFGLREASEGDQIYFVRHDTDLKQWPQNDPVEACTAISISSKENLKLPSNLNFPFLQFLELSGEGSVQISREYFGGMGELRVVSFKGKSITFTPIKDPEFFMNVQTLCLNRCRLTSDLGFIGSMHKLEILSFFKCDRIKVLPNEISQLSNLKLLDLRGCSVGLISSSVLSCLTRLEDLYMGDYFNVKKAENRNEGNCASIAEFYSLSSLKTLQVSVSELEVFLKLKDFFFDKLTRFDICLNKDIEWQHNNEFPNRIVLTAIDFGLFIWTKLEALTRTAEVLNLVEVNGLKNIISDSDASAYMNLKQLRVRNSSDLVELCHGNLPEGSMGMLEEVYLGSLSALTSLWRGEIHFTSFMNLKVFEIYRCNAIRSLFSPSVVRCLVQLQKLQISDCGMLEEICSKDEDAKMLEFPNLIELNLFRLPSLMRFATFSNITDTERSHDRSIFNEGVLLPCIERLHLWYMKFDAVKILDAKMQSGTSFYKLRYLRLECCPTISVVAASEEIKLLQNLETLSIELCSAMETVFDLERVAQHGSEEMILGQLDSITIFRTNELRHIWRNVPKSGLIHGSSFHKLAVLHIGECTKLSYLLSSRMAKLLVNLQVIELSFCTMMEQVVMEEKDNECETEKKVVFPKLRELDFKYMDSLTSFYDGSQDLEFSSLEKVSTNGCFEIKTFCSGSLSAPKLISVEDGGLSFPWMRPLINLIKSRGGDDDDVEEEDDNNDDDEVDEEEDYDDNSNTDDDDDDDDYDDEEDGSDDDEDEDEEKDDVVVDSRDEEV